MRTLTVVFSVLIITIITLANYGWLGAHLGWLYTVPGGDKLAHFLLIGTLAALAELSTGGHRWRWGNDNLPSASLVVTVLVVLEEVSQAWIPTRTFSLVDLGANLAGIALLGSLARYWLAATPTSVASDSSGKT